ncbi:uncharacterized protein RHOBADRAFT_50463 [Rhodotorula graminis WP1]|uniref:DH domain-containing protein n=1 Tax=Rhodotorula graminis (strain WP1) TaxID=578459 RepID=A0A194SBG0_RHOGW|nr:uncharacterized protein RHOBADRAFT_50463 [Rhodotorula graminis WP1]KPV77937.1 hypothetical protein RHOBADRAFT_50463 [Rhodotorula graminis WP1]
MAWAWACRQRSAAPQDTQDRLHANGNLRERNGNPSRTASAGSTSSSSPPTVAAAPHKPAHVDRSLSPTSLSPSLGHSLGTRQYGGVASIDFADRDPTQIYAPTTWSEMAHQELVNNLSPRERTRQEILWEVVASEERYVAELRSLVNLYANKLLHTLAPSPSLTPSPRFGFSPELGAHPHASASTSSASLPIASRFARTPTPEPVAADGEHGHGHPRMVRIVDAPDMDGGHSAAMRRGGSGGTNGSAPHLAPASASGRRHASSSSTVSGTRPPSSSSGSSPNLSVSSRIASAFRSSRHSSRTTTATPSPSAPPGMSSAPEAPLALPLELRDALEACVEMLRGHDELSARLKEQWARAFPLVRGLAAIWSDQPWFLGTYTTYVLSLEPALASLDRLLPSSLPHSHASSTTSSSSASHKLSQADKRLARALHDLELEAADLGESGLGICLSKPLMRLGKLPLLMQALLYHTDPTTHEWEKTRAMALEVDALVRSIEDEKVEEEERERTRDALARIDGVKDKTLMAPRAARILISEHPAPTLSQSAGPSATASGSTRAKFARRMSGAVGGGGKKGGTSGKGSEWLVSFTDVVVRAVKTGETSIPGSFSREKEKRGKQGAPRKVGKTRNTYRFVRIERWEPPEFAAQKLEELNERRRSGRAAASEDEELEDDDEDGFDVESRMSFRYDADSPQPLLAPPRSFLSPSKHSKRAPSPSSLSPSLAQPSSAKFGARLRAETPVPHPHHHSHAQARSPHLHAQPLRATTPLPSARFDAPTVSSQAKVHGSPPSPPSLPAKPREAAKESSSSGGGGLSHARDPSSFALYQMWAGTQDDD